MKKLHCIVSGGLSRRTDIITYKNNIGYVIDPTIRSEQSYNQPFKVQIGIENIYEPCILYLKSKFNLEVVEITKLFIGVGFTFTGTFEEFKRKFKF